MRVQTTDRGFQMVEFIERNGEPCSLQQSSAIDDVKGALDKPGSSFVWLGCNGRRMHLSREMVRELVEHLNQWLSTGEFQNT